MTERFKEGQLVGIALKESEARLKIQKIELGRVRYVNDYLIYRPEGDTREYLFSPDGPGIQRVIPELSKILDFK